MNVVFRKYVTYERMLEKYIETVYPPEERVGAEFIWPMEVELLPVHRPRSFVLTRVTQSSVNGMDSSAVHFP